MCIIIYASAARETCQIQSLNYWNSFYYFFSTTIRSEEGAIEGLFSVKIQELIGDLDNTTECDRHDFVLYLNTILYWISAFVIFIQSTGKPYWLNHHCFIEGLSLNKIDKKTTLWSAMKKGVKRIVFNCNMILVLIIKIFTPMRTWPKSDRWRESFT